MTFRENRLAISRMAGLFLVLLCCFGIAAVAWTQGVEPQGKVASKPLFRDPVHDGAADPTLIWNRQRHEWWMFYTNRRADLPGLEPNDVSWVHGTRIGIAVSRDNGATWKYRGVASIPYGKADWTQWAPDIVYDQRKYHMFLVIVPGTFKDWNAPRYIVHLTSGDLENWKFIARVETGSDRIIDPSLFRGPDGNWRMWYKDEQDKSHIYYAESRDLYDWVPKGPAITDRESEGPKIFRWKGRYWMITDAWKGLGVYHSDDLTHWVAQPENILEAPGHTPTDQTKGDHCDVVVSGEQAFIFYFTEQRGEDLDKALPFSERRTVLQVAELQEKDGVMMVDRDAPARVYLQPPVDEKVVRRRLRF